MSLHKEVPGDDRRDWDDDDEEYQR